MSACRFFLGVVLALILSGCSTFTYLLDQGAVLARMRHQKISLAEAQRRPEYQKYHPYLTWVPEIKKFVVEALGFPPTGSYESFLPESKKNHWVLSAVRRDVLIPKSWSFPILGSFPYIGYFDQASLQSELTWLERDGYDTYVRTSAAFSGLGFFDMPVFESMMQDGEAPFIEVLIHELTHEAYYVYGATAFNEGMAQLMGEQGALLFLKQQEAFKEQVPRYLDRLARDHRYRTFILSAWVELKKLLGTDSKARSPQNWQENKKRIFDELVTQLRRENLVDLRDTTPWNNARLYASVIYLEDHCHLEALYRREHPSGDANSLKTFFQGIQKNFSSDDPSQQVLSQLGPTEYCPTTRQPPGL